MSHRRRRAIATGFTLLEVLVVLTIIAMAVGVAAPAIWQRVESARERAWKEELLNHIAGLPLEAYSSGQRIQLSVERLRQAIPDIPAAVDVRIRAPMAYEANGSATGGRIELRDATGHSEIILVEPVTGRVRRPS